MHYNARLYAKNSIFSEEHSPSPLGRGKPPPQTPPPGHLWHLDFHAFGAHARRLRLGFCSPPICLTTSNPLKYALDWTMKLWEWPLVYGWMPVAPEPWGTRGHEGAIVRGHGLQLHLREQNNLFNNYFNSSEFRRQTWQTREMRSYYLLIFVYTRHYTYNSEYCYSSLKLFYSFMFLIPFSLS